MADEVRKIFNKFDQNGDGKISSGELKEMLQTLGTKTTSEEVDRIMGEIDKNAEFHSAGAKDGADATKELRDAFDLYDLDKNGMISAGELHSVVRKLGEECPLSDCREMISAVNDV